MKRIEVEEPRLTRDGRVCGGVVVFLDDAHGALGRRVHLNCRSAALDGIAPADPKVALIADAMRQLRRMPELRNLRLKPATENA